MTGCTLRAAVTIVHGNIKIYVNDLSALPVILDKLEIAAVSDRKVKDSVDTTCATALHAQRLLSKSLGKNFKTLAEAMKAFRSLVSRP